MIIIIIIIIIVILCRQEEQQSFQRASYTVFFIRLVFPKISGSTFSAYWSSRRNIIVFFFSPSRQMSGKYSIKLRALPSKCTPIQYLPFTLHSADIFVKQYIKIMFSSNVSPLLRIEFLQLYLSLLSEQSYYLNFTFLFVESTYIF
jgi:hypothetical protein